MFLKFVINIVHTKSVRICSSSFRTINNTTVRAMKIYAVRPKLELPNGKFIKFCIIINLKKNSWDGVVGVTISC
jgi:hypothetical protein